MQKRIAIFGATGGTGKALVDQALGRYRVTAFARSPDKLAVSNEELRVVRGDALRYEDVLTGVRGQDVVLCCLGAPSSDTSRLRTLGTTNIVRAMEASGVRRFICQTSLGYLDTEAMLPWHMKYLVVPFVLKRAFEDHELQEAVIDKSELAWTIARPGNLTNGKLTENYKHGFGSEEKSKLKVSRADVAHFMLNQIEEERYLYRKVAVSY